MLPPFRRGVGGPVGSGRQYLPWIHLHDLVASREFARALGRALHRPSLLPVPAFPLRAIFGEAAVVLLGSQRIEPAVLRARGFSFAFPTIDVALADILSGPAVKVRPVSGPTDASGSASRAGYLQKRPPIFELRATTILKVPVDEAFAFFSKAENLGMLTPAAMRFSISGRVPEIAEGTTIDYRLQVGSVPIAWRSRIVDWRPGVRFVDQQERGPYRSWYHEHMFRAEGASTVMEDRVYYAPPFGLIGRFANRFFIVPTLRRIFQYRADVIRLRFGAI